MKWEDWAEKYKPTFNPYNAWDDVKFETYGEEFKYVSELDSQFVWTLLDNEQLIAGRKIVNAVSYYVTENPWSEEDRDLLIDIS